MTSWLENCLHFYKKKVQQGFFSAISTQIQPFFRSL